MKILITLGLMVVLFTILVSSSPAGEKRTYTSALYLYSIDYPADWRVKEISKITMFLSPLESKNDHFAENVDVVVEDLSPAGDVSLLDYHRKAISTATSMLEDFELLEEAKTIFTGHEAVAVLYTAKVKGEIFRFKSYTLLVGKNAYVLTYKALNGNFDKYLPAAEKIMRSLQASP